MLSRLGPLAILLIGAMLVGAFQPPIGVVPPTPVTRPSPTLTTGSVVLLYDDFEDRRQNRWPSGGSVAMGGVRGYADGGYRISVRKPEWLLWSLPRDPQIYDNITVEFEARALPGSALGEYGLACRIRHERSGAYLLFLSNDGGGRIVRATEDQEIEIGASVYDDAIRIGGGINDVRADCVRDRLTLYVNGFKIVEAYDDSWSEGYLALIAGTWQEARFTAWFDNVRVSEPLPRPPDGDDLTFNESRAP